MLQFLVKRWIKDFENVTDPVVRTSYGIFASMMGIVCNLILVFLKLGVGIALNSISVISDALNNLSDAASSVVGFVGVRMAEKPADKDHPFGHGRIEYVAAFIVAFLVIQVGFTLLQSSIQKIAQPETIHFSLLSVMLLALSVLVKVWMAYYNTVLGKRISSTVLKATAADSIGDIVVTTATILSLLIYGIWEVNVDGWVGLGVSVMVMFAGFNIARETLEPLIGEAIPEELYKEMTDFVENYDGILGSHDLIVHSYGPTKKMATIHAEVADDMDMTAAHQIVDQIERDCNEKLGICLVIHMDPVAVHDERAQHYKRLTKQALQVTLPEASMHDFRVSVGKTQVKLIFDLLIPYSISPCDRTKLNQEINRQIKTLDEMCECIVTFDYDFQAK